MKIKAVYANQQVYNAQAAAELRPAEASEWAGPGMGLKRLVALHLLQ